MASPGLVVRAVLATAAVAAGLLSGASPVAAAQEDRTPPPFTVADVVEIAGKAVGEPVGWPQRAVVVDGVDRDLTPEQMEALLAGRDIDGIAVRLVIGEPSAGSTISGMLDEAGVTGSSARVILDMFGFKLSIDRVKTATCETVQITTTTTSTDSNGNTVIETNTWSTTRCIL